MSPQALVNSISIPRNNFAAAPPRAGFAAKGHKQIYDSSAVSGLEVSKRVCRLIFGTLSPPRAPPVSLDQAFV
jgi:hypothetical protein